MKFEVGDTVRLLHSGEEGHVVEWLSEDMVRVDVDGMVFPVFADQIEHPYYNRFLENRKEKATEKKQNRIKGEAIPIEKIKPVHRKESGVFLSLLPVYGPLEEEPIIDYFKLYLVNETRLTYTFHCKEFLNGAIEFEVKSDLQPFSQFYIKKFPFECLNDRPRFEFHFIPENPGKELSPSFHFQIKLKSKQVIKKLTELNAKQQAMFNYTIFKRYPLKKDVEVKQWDLPPISRQAQYYKPNIRSSAIELRYEVDLHIEKLTDDFRNLTPSDMLLLQTEELHKALEAAIAQRQHSMIVIHGIGKGVLKEEVHAILKQIPEVSRFVNQYDFRYGFGATEIFFEYNAR